MLKRLFRPRPKPVLAVPGQTVDQVVYNVLHERYGDVQAERDDLKERLKARDIVIAKLAVEQFDALHQAQGQLEEANHLIEVLQAQVEHLQVLASSAPEEVKQARRKKTFQVPQ